MAFGVWYSLYYSLHSNYVGILQPLAGVFSAHSMYCIQVFIYLFIQLLIPKFAWRIGDKPCADFFFIKVKIVPKIKDDREIDQILKEVEKLVHYAMDVVIDRAEKCRDPGIPY